MLSIFNYKGRDIKGNIATGSLEANRIEEVIAHLAKHEITPLNIKPASRFSMALSNIFAFGKKGSRIQQYHVMNFYRQLATLNDSGLSLVKALNRLAESAIVRNFGQIIADVASSVASGMSLTDAFKKHPDVFSNISVSMIDVGENTGRLSEILLYLASHIEATIVNKRRLVGAIRYPIFVLISIVISIIVMDYFVIPKFAAIFSSFKIQLPWATRVIIATSEFLVNYRNSIIVAAVVIVVGVRQLLNVPAVRYFWDQHKLGIPVFGSLQRRILLSQFTWTFGLILRAGVPIMKGIALASTAIDNVFFSEKLLKMRSDIEHGENLSEAAIASGLFTPMTIQMIEVGEESEKMDDILSALAKYYDAEIDYDLKHLSEMIEPFLLAAIGGMVLVMALGIYFPLWDLIQIAKM